MDSRGWLIGLGLATAALAALLVADLRRAPEAESASDRIVPEWDAARVRAVRIERLGRPALMLRREADHSWRLEAPGATPVPVDSGALRDLFGTIEILAAIRHDAGTVDHPRLTVVIERDGGPPIRLLLAPSGSGPTDRVWLARAGQGGRFLVDGYAARALDVTPDQLRERRPFRDRLDGATRIEVAVGVDSAVLSGPPWQVQLAGGAARAAPDQVRDLIDRCSRMRIDEFADLSSDAAPRSGTAPAARIAVEARGGRSEIAYRGTCPGGAPLVDTPVGRGCLPPAYAPAGLAADPARWVDRRLVGAPIDSVLRVRLERGGRTIAVERAADPDVLRAWLHRWRDAAAGPLVPADRLSPPLATVALDTDGGGREHLMIGRTPEGALGARRDGEPVALLLQPWADAHLEPAPHRFHSLDLLSHDPTALRGATARRGERVLEAIERGDTLEEWRALAPARAQVAAAAVESLRQAVGFLRAETFAAERAQPRHGLSPPRRTIELQFDPAPAADPGQAQGPARPEPPARPHTIEIGAPIAGGACYARLDRDPAVFELSAARCTALLGPWTSPSSRRQPEH